MRLLSCGGPGAKGEIGTCTNSDGAQWTAVTANVTCSSGHPRGSTWEGFLEEGECELKFQTGKFEVGDGEGRGAGSGGRWS